MVLWKGTEQELGQLILYDENYYVVVRYCMGTISLECYVKGGTVWRKSKGETRLTLRGTLRGSITGQSIMRDFVKNIHQRRRMGTYVRK